MDKLVELKRVTFFHPGKETQPVLDEISLSLGPNEFVLLIGPSGCGKTTLLSAIAGVLTTGTIRGTVLVEGADMYRGEDKKRGTIGFVLQDPESQLLNLNVSDEVAFGLENLCLPKDEIRERMDEAITYARLQEIRESFIYALSGGQKQRVSIAAGLAMRPKVLLMDGPVTNLDPQGASEVLQLITRMRKSGTEAVVLAANKIDALLPLATRILVMDKGKIILDGPPEIILERLDLLQQLGIFVPELGPVIKKLLPEITKMPRTVEEAAKLLLPMRLVLPDHRDRSSINNNQPVIEASDVRFGYDEEDEVLHGVSFEVRQGEFLAVVGQNGSGKTTLMKLVAGLRDPQSGTIRVFGKDTRAESPLGKVGYVFQYPEHQFVTPTVEEELSFGLELLDLSPGEIANRAEKMLEIFGLEGRQGESPYILSMGEKRRLSVATMLALEPQLLILDEPTTGLDRRDTENLMQLLEEFVQEQGITVIQVSHDMEQIAEFCSRVVALGDGKIIFEGTPRALFRNKKLLVSCKLGAPPVAELSQRLWPDAVEAPITVKEFTMEVKHAAA